jgi:hypothetical protein
VFWKKENVLIKRDISEKSEQDKINFV